MARISTYISDPVVSALDRVIGSDNENNNATKNFSVGALALTIADFLSLGTFTFNQSTPATTWLIPHNLEKFPSVTIVDSSGNVIMGETLYTNNNNITLTFSAPFTGKAYLN